MDWAARADALETPATMVVDKFGYRPSSDAQVSIS